MSSHGSTIIAGAVVVVALLTIAAAITTLAWLLWNLFAPSVGLPIVPRSTAAAGIGFIILIWLLLK